MLDPAQVPAVSSHEIVARYLVFSKWIRSSEGTVKPEAFIPHPHQDLSVTRHQSATEKEIWEIGRMVAASSGKKLHGRADVNVDVFTHYKLATTADAITGNPNHAVVTKWPNDKPAQKLIAIEIAIEAQYVRPPQSDNIAPAEASKP